MYKNQIITKQEFPIDKVEDGIKFNLVLFNQGTFDKNKLRTIIRNTGVKLEVLNELENDLEILNVYFGIFKEGKLIKRFSSSKISETLPSILSSNKSQSFYFYGSEIKDKLDDFVNEEAMFYISSNKFDNYILSTKFKGETIENFITDLEEDEIANWGDKIFNTLNIEEDM